MTDNQQLIHLEAAFIMQNLGGILPNLEKMVAVYYDKDKGYSADYINLIDFFMSLFDKFKEVYIRELRHRGIPDIALDFI